MKRYITIILLSYMCFFSMYAQHSAKDCLYDLYKVLSTCHNKDYIGIGDCNYSISSLYQGKNERIIFDAIKNACIFSYGNPLDSVVEVNLGNKVLYFMVNTESPRSFKYSDINSIYDGNGLSLVDRDDYMKFPAVINDPDGFTYVRERPSTKSKVKTKIRRNQIFLYTPIWGSGWCRAYSDDGSLFIGYIYRKRILPFDKCPVDIKKKMIIFMFD